MRAILPGKPPAKPQALSTVQWDGLRVVVGLSDCCSPPSLSARLTSFLEQAYISGKALIILEDAQKVIQTLYVDEAGSLEAVTIDEESGKMPSVTGLRSTSTGPLAEKKAC